MELRYRIIECTANMVTPTRIQVDNYESVSPANYINLRYIQKAALESNTEFRKVGLSVFKPIEIKQRHRQSSLWFKTTIYVKPNIDNLLITDRATEPFSYVVLKCGFGNLKNCEVHCSQGFILSSVLEAKGCLRGRIGAKVRVVLSTSTNAEWVNEYALRNEGDIVKELWLHKLWVDEWESGYMTDVWPWVGLPSLEDFTWGQPY